jgi:hypothetical protein
VIGQIGRGLNGDWKVIPTHEDIHREAIVSLAEAPEILQSIGPGGKLFNPYTIKGTSWISLAIK